MKIIIKIPLCHQWLWGPIYHQSVCISSHIESVIQNLQQFMIRKRWFRSEMMKKKKLKYVLGASAEQLNRSFNEIVPWENVHHCSDQDRLCWRSDRESPPIAYQSMWICEIFYLGFVICLMKGLLCDSFCYGFVNTLSL